METTIIHKGSRQVVISEDELADMTRRFTARLYVNNGETPTMQMARRKTRPAILEWATAVLA